MNELIVTSNEEILELVACQKMIKFPPKKAQLVNKNVTRNFNVYSVNGEMEFQVFITYSQLLPEDFSIGLMHNGMLLYRCNGYHGTTRAGFFKNIS